MLLAQCGALLLPVRALSALTERDAQLLYAPLKDIQSVAIIAVSLVGDAEKNGLNEKELTRFVQEKFSRHMSGTLKFEDIGKDSKRFLSLIATGEKKVGNITLRVWVAGTSSPLVYHIRCDAGNFENPAIWTDETLGYGNPGTIDGNIRAVLDEMMIDLGDTFRKIKHPGP